MTEPITKPDIAATLAAAGCVAADEEAEELLRAADGDTDGLKNLVSRRIEGEPLAWLVGSVSFCGIRVAVEPGVYVPRRHTEQLAEKAVTLLPQGGCALDVCTGSGAIAAVLAESAPAARVIATELDPKATACARRNGVTVFEGFLDDPIPKEYEHRVDVLTAVVPYVPTDAIRLLPRDVQAFEPRLALDGGADGTDILVEVARRSTRWLKPGGWLLLELGGDQAGPIGQLLGEIGFEAATVISDEDGDVRVISARRAE